MKSLTKKFFLFFLIWIHLVHAAFAGGLAPAADRAIAVNAIETIVIVSKKCLTANTRWTKAYEVALQNLPF
jgi:hypothetical protein